MDVLEPRNWCENQRIDRLENTIRQFRLARVPEIRSKSFSDPPHNRKEESQQKCIFHSWIELVEDSRRTYSTLK